MTPQGQTALKNELRECKTERVLLADVILAARELGDLSENAEYHAAKEKQGMLEARIRYLESKLAQAEVIDPKKLSGDKVIFGATVQLTDVDSDEERTYRIVGEDESDVKQGTISFASPVARSIIGRYVGDEVKVRVPGGTRIFEILAVSFD